MNPTTQLIRPKHNWGNLPTNATILDRIRALPGTVARLAEAGTFKSAHGDAKERLALVVKPNNKLYDMRDAKLELARDLQEALATPSPRNNHAEAIRNFCGVEFDDVTIDKRAIGEVLADAVAANSSLQGQDKEAVQDIAQNNRTILEYGIQFWEDLTKAAGTAPTTTA